MACGAGVTTMPPYLARLVPSGVRLVRVADSEPVVRRASIARLPTARSVAVDQLCSVLRDAASELPGT